MDSLRVPTLAITLISYLSPERPLLPISPSLYAATSWWICSLVREAKISMRHFSSVPMPWENRRDIRVRLG